MSPHARKNASKQTPGQDRSGFWLILALAAGLLALAFMLRGGPVLSASMMGAAALLLTWMAALLVSGRSMSLEVVVRRPHWVQMVAQALLFGFWGWHLPAIRVFGPLIIAQLLFAYGFAMLLSWSRRGRYELGFGPVPITLSINLFLLFKPQWFYWQFAMIALGYLAKEFIRWERDGRSAHIFNPSSFPLAVFSLVLIAMGATNTTLGLEIATTLFNPPHIFLWIFLVALPGQLLFGVGTMTASAVVTTYLFGLVYFRVTGTYYFFDSYIPIAVFLGAHLLVTDPSTSPRTESGRVMFGVLYAFGNLFLVWVLERIGAPTFYDKLLPIPILNLTVVAIDRLWRSGRLDAIDVARLGSSLGPAERRVAIVGIWTLVFVSLSSVGGLGDEHPGQYLPFWEQACEAGSARGCEHLSVMQDDYCVRGSAWACNETGLRLAALPSSRANARTVFRRGCDMGFTPACENAAALDGGSTATATAPPLLVDLRILVGGSKGILHDVSRERVAELACERGWVDVCGRSFN